MSRSRWNQAIRPRRARGRRPARRPRRRRRSSLARRDRPPAVARPTPIKAAWIYVGPHNDGGWSQAHDNGRLYVQKMLGSKVQTTYKENIAERPAARADGREPRPRRQQDHLRRRRSAIVRQEARREVPERASSSRRPGPTCRRTWPSTSAPVRTRSTCPAWPQAPPRRTARSATSSRSRIPEVIRHANAFTLGAQAVQPEARR